MISFPIASRARDQHRARLARGHMSLHRIEHRRAERDGLNLGPTHGPGHVFVEHRQVVRRRPVSAQEAHPSARRRRTRFAGNRILFCQLLTPHELDGCLSRYRCLRLDATALLENRVKGYEAARARNPERWSGHTRNWQPVLTCTSNPRNRSAQKPNHQRSSIQNSNKPLK